LPLSFSITSFAIPLAVKKIEFDMDAQKVFVKSSLSGEELLDIIKKTGRECSYVGLKK